MALLDDMPAKKRAAGKGRQMYVANVVLSGKNRSAVRDGNSSRVEQQCVSKQNVDFWIFAKEFLNFRERTGKVLLVTIQVSKHIACGTSHATIDRVVHAGILFYERLYARI